MEGAQPAGAAPGGVDSTEIRRKGDYKQALAFCQPFKDKHLGDHLSLAGAKCGLLLAARLRAAICQCRGMTNVSMFGIGRVFSDISSTTLATLNLRTRGVAAFRHADKPGA